MKFYLLAFVSLFQFLTLQAFADHTDGTHGVHLVVCQQNGISTRTLLDYFEGQNRWNLKIELGSEDYSAERKVEVALARINKWNPERAKLLRQNYLEFLEKSDFLNEYDLANSSDVGTASIPNGCELKQIAQLISEPKIPGEKIYLIDNDEYSQLSNTQKAGVILHLLISREAHSSFPEFHRTSERIRYLNATVGSSQFDSFRLKQYIQRLCEARFLTAQAHFLHPMLLMPTASCDVEFWDDSIVASHRVKMVKNTEPIVVNIQDISVQAYVHEYVSSQNDNHDAKVRYTRSGKFRYVKIFGEFLSRKKSLEFKSRDGSVKYKCDNNLYDYSCSKFFFTEDDNLGFFSGRWTIEGPNWNARMGFGELNEAGLLEMEVSSYNFEESNYPTPKGLRWFSPSQAGALEFKNGLVIRYLDKRKNKWIEI